MAHTYSNSLRHMSADPFLQILGTVTEGRISSIFLCPAMEVR